MGSSDRYLFRERRIVIWRRRAVSVLWLVARCVGWALFFWLAWLSDGTNGDLPRNRKEWKWSILAVVGAAAFIGLLYWLFPAAMSGPL